MNRNRTDPAIISYGLYLYFSSRSFRLSAKCLESIIKRSHVALWKWVQRYSELAAADNRFRIDRRQVKQIFVDETLLKVDGHEYWLWIAYEPSLDVCLMMHLSRERTIFICYRFFKQIRDRFGRKPVFTDGALWYNTACRWLRLKHEVYDIKRKNMMERFIQYLKDRTECFDDHFPCQKKDCDRQHVWNWLKMFLLYQNMSADRIQFMMFLIGGDGA
jgi:putative transposase